MTVVASIGNSAIPALNVHVKLTPSASTNESRRNASSTSSMRSTASGAGTPSKMTRNSSPPHRPASVGSPKVTTSAKRRSTSSPAGWPCTSLTRLKLSRSTSATDTDAPSAAARPVVRSSTRSAVARFANPVSPSASARRRCSSVRSMRLLTRACSSGPTIGFTTMSSAPASKMLCIVVASRWAVRKMIPVCCQRSSLRITRHSSMPVMSGMSTSRITTSGTCSWSAFQNCSWSSTASTLMSPDSSTRSVSRITGSSSTASTVGVGRAASHSDSTVASTTSGPAGSRM